LFHGVPTESGRGRKTSRTSSKWSGARRVASPMRCATVRRRFSSWAATAPVGIGTIAGARSAGGDVAVAYFDLHSDLNTPASARDGALDWMALAHILAIEGSQRTLAAATGQVPLLDASQVVLFAHSQSDATRFERAEIERLGMARFALEDVRGDPEAAARQAVELVAARSDRHVIHLDVDVVDFTDAPLSEHPSRNTGLKLGEMLSALKILASAPGLVAITLAELNTHNAAADDGLLERFAASFADAIGTLPQIEK
jgi:arginase